MRFYIAVLPPDAILLTGFAKSRADGSLNELPNTDR
jgi:hypothetical protein